MGLDGFTPGKAERGWGEWGQSALSDCSPRSPLEAPPIQGSPYAIFSNMYRMVFRVLSPFGLSLERGGEGG